MNLFRWLNSKWKSWFCDNTKNNKAAGAQYNLLVSQIILVIRDSESLFKNEF